MMQFNSSSKSQCRRGFAHIVAVRADSQTVPMSVNDNDVAGAVGVVMDRCTKGGNYGTS
jgi:hypothetical protein